MARIPEEVIQSVQDAVDIVDIISRFVTLKRSGSSYKGLCPFHEEKTPSFSVFPSSGRFKCFGCGEAGDAVAFLMRRNNLSFRDALEELAREAGIAIPVAEESPADREHHRRRQEALEALRFAAAFYRTLLSREVGDAGREYLTRTRGYAEETLTVFEIGFAPDQFEGLRSYANAKGFKDDVLFEAGLIRRNERGLPFDMFRGRIMFPIHDLRGQVVGFGARAMGDAQPKYLNSPDSAIFRKGREMYGLHVARSAAVDVGRLLVVEGYTDVMQCHEAGLREVAAGLGTALTPENARQLKRFAVPVQLVYDGDEAGRRAAERAADVLLAEAVEGSVVILPPGQDPADLLVREGRDALEAALAEAQDLWEYRLRRALERHDQTTLEGRGRAVDELMDTIGGMADATRQNVALKLLAEKMGVLESTLRNRPIRGRGRPRAPLQADARPASTAWGRFEMDVLRAALADSSLWDRLLEEYPPAKFTDPDLRRVAEAVSDLAGRGESITLEGLQGLLADQDAAVRALLALEEADEEVVARVRGHLEHLAQDRRVQTALASKDLEAVVKARKGSPPAAPLGES
ncbi:MAG: DNA primase [Planctomycetota bacterium]